MIEIVVDYETKELIIDHGAGSEEKIKISKPLEIEYLIRKVLDKVYYSGESVELTKRDDEHKYTIQRW